MERSPAVFSRYAAPLFGAGLLAALYTSSLYSYVLFHSLAELFSVVVACGIFIVGWNSRRFLTNNYLLFLGIAYLFVAAIDTVHTLAYKGMGVFPGYDANLPTQLWVAARYIESLSLLAAPLFIRRKLNAGPVFAAYVVVFALVLLSIFYRPVFPDAFVEGAGLTRFKVASEYVISAILLGAAGLLYRSRQRFDRRVWWMLEASILVTVAEEMAFTLYVDPYGFFNMIGHFLKIVSFYLIYKAIIETGLTAPYNLLFRDLKQREETLASQAAQLAQANAELEAVNRDLEAFSYSVSHDLRSPLSAIDGFSYLVLKDPDNKLNEQSKDYLNEVRAAVQDMSGFIDELLSFSRAAHSEIKREPVDLSAIARDVAAGLQRMQPDRRVEFVISDGLIVNGDAVLLRAVLENLLGNAWKFTGKKPGAGIEFSATPVDGGTAYFVRDNGAGFDMDYAHKLFVPFQRLHSAEEFKGTGIGLATVQRIVQRHGGKVWAEGAVGRGATFFFTL
ncbi:MAG: hypothetical protein HY673_00645 [Chloroflexi bacterium]|nr:hypothetical protein [Chloroflexota bacterium]